ncbi:FtsX-like permease family protein [Evansella cellulosilytica]|uniref:ABC3 transporter permease C-terminal domain-containing protein n=1 Tax=Evansella cellulosilytica (strain ATCC 21833 / DSM 2522 / FERM P-1141 / JCM 9156 / N-4) TaxID=649639 RepID=E6TYG1_EVAC2|nr:FtsX-like permease family protein [Evansella cellulosilytica]ADU28899.1 protein of unknown function DUF214 [Evansella cellulosilytica DSM 2522]
MKLSTLALRNIKLNFKKYVIYFFSLSFSVFTTYSFLALIQNEDIKQQFIYDDRYQSLLISFGFLIMVFVIFFLISSNNSFIKARKKEISTYSLFGMSNIKIGKLLFIETIIVGAGTLIIGIGAGIFFSKLIAMILLDITLASFTGHIAFSIDPMSIVITVSIFFIIFVLMGLSGLRVISKFELVDLFKASKISEGRTKGSYFGLLFSFLLIGIGYRIATLENQETVATFALLILILVIGGTYMFFWVGLPKILYLLKKNKRMYLKGDNLIATSSLSHRVLTISSTMATIAILSAVATTAIATGYTLYSNVEVNTYNTVGYDMYYYGGDEDVLEAVYNTFVEHDTEMTEQYSVMLYKTSPHMQDVWGDGVQYIHADNDHYFRIYSSSEFNELTAISRLDIPPLSLATGEAVYVRGFIPDEMQEALMNHELLFSVKTLEITSSKEIPVGEFGAIHTIVIHDEDYDALYEAGDIKLSLHENSEAHVFNFERALSSQELNKDLNALLSGKVGSYRTALNNFNEGMETFGLVCFIGFFMSVVFILMTASLLYFKQMMAAEEEKHQFKMLRKIGMDSKTEKKVIRKRLLPVFLLPLLVGILHSIFAMKSADTMVFTYVIAVENSYLTVLAFSTVMYILYALVYGLFFFITKSQFARIVK